MSTPPDERELDDHEVVVTSDAPVSEATTSWQRLHHRMIWVDVVRSLLSLTPAALAVWVFGVEPSLGSLWPVIMVAVVGVVGAAADALRWVFTRYRVTDDHVERRTGVFVRRYRSVRRERIRSVDTEAKLRHRLAGLRVVKVGAGQQATAGESALALDAVLKQDAERLRRVLLSGRPDVDAGRWEAGTTTEGTGAEIDGPTGSGSDDHQADEQVFVRLRPRWVVYNLFSIWAYVMALGLLWGAYWLGTTFGFDVAGFIAGLLDWEALGWVGTVAVAALAVGGLGVVGMGINFFTENWGFELARVPGEKGTLLRTRRGLFRVREVNRADDRMRGIEISEPLLWRWMGMADTNVITTGLDLWSTSQPTTILPRGPIDVARRAATAVLAVEPSPLETPLERHPRAALRRRVWWATLTSSLVVGVLAWLATAGAVPQDVVWAGAALWPLALGGAVVAYRALGHALLGDHLVVRSGLMSRSTSALQRSAVSTVAIRESLLQRRLGLQTVSMMTAAGWAIYEAPDLATDDALRFATAGAPGLLSPFLAARNPAPSGVPASGGPDGI